MARSKNKETISSIPSGQESGAEEQVNVTAWLNRISKAKQKEQYWRERARHCIKIYRDDNKSDNDNLTSSNGKNIIPLTFNILHANTETLAPALFSANPKPDVRNRYLTQNKVAELAGQAIERCLTYSIDTYNFLTTMKSAIKDYLLPGRAVVRVRLLPQWEEEKIEVINDKGEIEEKTQEIMVSQKVPCELVPWDSFTVEPAKTWADVTWISFEHMLSLKEFEEFFPGAPLVAACKETDQYGVDPQYQVNEIWDKTTKKVYFIGQAEKPLKVLDDPLQLTDFWPTPEPLYSIKTNDTLVPIPEYTIYQAQAHELNVLSSRIIDLTESCKFVGVYDSIQTGLNDMLRGRDSQLIPVSANLLKNGGIKSVVDFLDISRPSQVLAQLSQQREQTRQIINEITGISDIIRGESNASETATAQNIKASYAGLRLRDRRDNINRYIVDLLRIKAEVIATFFTTEQIQEMSGIEITPEVEELIRSDVLRAYKIDIETDSTIMADMEQEAQARAAIVASIIQLVGTAAPLVMQGVLPLETVKALMTYGLGASKITRELQDAIDLIGTEAPPEIANGNQQPPMNDVRDEFVDREQFQAPSMPTEQEMMPIGLQ